MLVEQAVEFVDEGETDEELHVAVLAHPGDESSGPMNGDGLHRAEQLLLDEVDQDVAKTVGHLPVSDNPAGEGLSHESSFL